MTAATAVSAAVLLGMQPAFHFFPAARTSFGIGEAFCLKKLLFSDIENKFLAAVLAEQEAVALRFDAEKIFYCCK